MSSRRLRDLLASREPDRTSSPIKSPRDKDKDKDKKDRRHRVSTASRTNSTKERDSHLSSSSSSSSQTKPQSKKKTKSDSTAKNLPAKTRRSSVPEVEELARSNIASFLESRTSLPYPGFSRAHSKDSVYNIKEDKTAAAERKGSIPTPDPTDLAEGRDEGKNSAKNGANGIPSQDENRNSPPSPPLTVDQRSSRKGSLVAGKGLDGDIKSKDGKSKVKAESDSPRSTPSPGKRKEDLLSKLGGKYSRPITPLRVKVRDSGGSPRSASQSTKSKSNDKVDVPKRSISHSAKSPMSSSITNAESTDSDVTSIAPYQPTSYQKPIAPTASLPSRTQSRNSTFDHANSRLQTPIELFIEGDSESAVNTGYGGSPPPPPPPNMPVAIPRVDYLLQNGGLGYLLPKTLLGAGESANMPEHIFQPQLANVKVFEPYHRLLDDYNLVMSKNGSVAVATGYRSVARRLLDRLEAVFARDISSEICRCIMCEDEPSQELASGVSWGDVLELVSGRKELPQWPPFQITTAVKSQMFLSEEHIPMQKLDVDVPEEYREHYVRQSRKTKVAVDKWLSGQTEPAPPEEVDDETMTFAIMTHLDAEQREAFLSLLGIKSLTPAPRSESATPRIRPEALAASSMAVERLYRLSGPPRDSETAIFMLSNPRIHNALATLAAISNDEWEILISGRFDGFLRSGAEDNYAPSMTASAPPRSGSRAAQSRGATPFQADGGFRPVSQPFGGAQTPSVPGSWGGPIVMDEDTEIAALAEIERNIYQSMEALEDAFEALHCKAEVVRRALRERGAGLSVANQARRGSTTNLDARLGTPASLNGSLWESGLEDDDGIDDDMSLAPDDSASNISSNRRRRPKRRSERRTPAPVEEVDEGEENDTPQASRHEGKSRRR
jgi:hypothetical protein